MWYITVTNQTLDPVKTDLNSCFKAFIGLLCVICLEQLWVWKGSSCYIWATFYLRHNRLYKLISVILFNAHVHKDLTDLKVHSSFFPCRHGSTRLLWLNGLKSSFLTDEPFNNCHHLMPSMFSTQKKMEFVQILNIFLAKLICNVWEWKGCYFFSAEVQNCVYNLCYIDELEVLMKVLCNIVFLIYLWI